ncbi:hypothetical protein CAC42_8250 [Sphaceloma murrayae]|uniref:Phospholipid/glycerol acyltransferase domain-containing protein n=1 Tax=Sphaceloma murrayae TaxID=2082308 RepID=A0A2K1QK16_9PEZI|nr:hypothetical protein CAC42_8250 [Sphaceloma murrayae]
MEKYGAFRDKGSGIAPFFPVPTQPSGLSLPFHAFLAFIRVPLLVGVSLTYFLLFSWLPIGSLGKKAALWCILGTPGIWWVDLQVDGVKRGMLGKNSSRLPHPGSVIVSSFTSPIDALYLAAIFDPLFTRSFSGTRQVQQISLWQAIFDALSLASRDPPIGVRLVDVSALLRENPDRCIAIFPECTTSNGRGILPFSPSVLTTPEKTKIFPISLKYTPADITTPLPGSYITFIWNLCSRPTHTIRVRIAEATYNTSASSKRTLQAPRRPSYETNLLDDLNHIGEKKLNGHADNDGKSEEERAVIDRIGEALARLGRIKRVGLGRDDKEAFVRVWNRRR